MNHISRRAKVEVFRFFHPGRLDKQIAQIKKNNIILKNRSSWTGRDIAEVKKLVNSMTETGVINELKAENQRIFVTRENGVKIESVTNAINEATSVIRGQSLLLPFQKGKVKMENIDLRISSKQGVPMYTPKKGTMIFGIKHPSKSAVLGLSKTQEEGFEEVSRIIEKQQLPQSDYKSLHLPHVNEVITAYYQIGAIFHDQGLIFGSEEIKEQKGFLRLFDKGVFAGRIKQNLRFLKSIYLSTPYEVIIPTIVFHDIGKIKPEEEASHPEVSAKLLEKDDSLEKSLGLDHVSWLIMKNSIKHHLVPGGISLGEYSFMSMYDIFQESEVGEIIYSGRVNEFIDTLTLLTACDIAGQGKFIPLNRKIEDLAVFNHFLKEALHKAISIDENTGNYILDENGRNYFHKKVLKFMGKTSETRLCRYLCGQDDNLDINTNFGYWTYRHKLKEAFNKMGVSKEDKNMLMDFFAMLKSFPYSGLPIHRLLWNLHGGSKTAGKLEDMEINENAVNFLIHLARRFFRYRDRDLLLKSIKQDKDFIITANLLRADGKPIHSIKKYNDEVEKLVNMINEGKGSFPEIEISEGEKTILINVSMTEPSKQKEKSN